MFIFRLFFLVLSRERKRELRRAESIIFLSRETFGLSRVFFIPHLMTQLAIV